MDLHLNKHMRKLEDIPRCVTRLVPELQGIVFEETVEKKETY